MPIAMVRVPATGPLTETMVDRRTGRSWTVEVSPFEIAATVVTTAEWQVACRAGTTGPRHGDLDEIAWYADNSNGAEVYGPYRIIRGGGWSDAHWGCRVGVRRKTHPEAAFDDLGFRLARTVVERHRPRRADTGG